MDRVVTPVCESLKSAVNSGHGYLAGLALGVPASYYIYGHYMNEKMKQKIKTRAQKTKDNIDGLKRELEANAHDIDPSLVELSFQELQAKLQSGEITATKVLRSYQAKALAVNDEINAITDVMKDAAEIARRLDALESSQRGPLHGIPISLKESCGVKGLDCTGGFGEMVDIPKEKDSILVQVLRSLGAIPFIRTNVPQGLRSLRCSNPLFGLTVNPLDTGRSPGGSSGGEGAIVGGHGSILGVGSDIGGSVRIPACWCGVTAIKPTAGRMSYHGNFSPPKKGMQKYVPPTDGPMAQDVFSIVHFMKNILCPRHFDLDPFIPPMPFRHEIYESKRPLKIGYYVHDGCTRCVPAVERAVMMSKVALQRLGHNVVEIEPYQSMKALSKLLIPTLVADNGKGYEDMIKYDNSDKALIGLINFQQKPYYMRWIHSKIREMTTYDPVNVEIMRRDEIRDSQAWIDLSRDVYAFRKDYSKYWKELGLDALICPCMPCVAPSNGVEMRILGVVSYTGIFNVTNYPAGTLPVTTVTKNDVYKTMDPSFYTAETDLEKTIQADSKNTEGLPVGIQVVSTPFMEENVLRIMTELENALKS